VFNFKEFLMLLSGSWVKRRCICRLIDCMGQPAPVTETEADFLFRKDGQLIGQTGKMTFNPAVQDCWILFIQIERKDNGQRYVFRLTGQDLDEPDGFTPGEFPIDLARQIVRSNNSPAP